MADIQSAAQWLGRLLIEEAKYLSAVEDKVHELQDELYWMQCFLRDADAIQYDSVMARRWVSQIREFAYEAEDTIEKFLIGVESRGRRLDFWLWVKRYSKMFWKARLVHKIGSDIDALKQKISILTSKLQTYRINIKLAESSSSWLLRKKHTFISSEEKNMIGRDHVLEELVNKFLESGTKKTSIVSICGVGGVGKTFLAKKIFNHTEIKKHFDAFAWAYVSEPCQISAVQQDLLSSLSSKSKEQISQMTNSELKDELCKVQRKSKCFIVLDGLWGMEVWERLKDSFPIANSNVESKLLITNRPKEVAVHVHQNTYICELEALSIDVGKLLLEEMVKNPPADDSGNIEKLKLNMLEHCEGLPLVISVLAGVLATKTKVEEWQEVHKHITSFSIDDQQTGHKSSRWKRILELSYHELPYQLKPSFLYLGYFLTNLEIPTLKIIRLWEAEGLVSSDEDDISEYTLEIVAESCLGELVERSLVQVGSRSLTGKVKTCLIHDLMRDLCKSKASQGNLLQIVPLGAREKDQQSSGQSSRRISKPAQQKFRRLAIYYSSTDSASFPLEYKHAKNIRSLLFFNTLTSEEVLIPIKSILEKAINRYKLLRVLDIENIDVQELPEGLGYLIHLRYLSIRGSWVTKLPSTIKNLKCLQTLDLRVLSFVRLRIPDVLCSLERLTHLHLPSKTFTLLHHKKSLQLNKLKNLETLSNFSNNCRADDVKELTSLRRFSSCDFLKDYESIKPLFDSPSSNLEHLEHLSLSLDGVIFEKHPEILANCSKLRKLWLKGATAEFLTSDMLPKGLIQISLNNSEFQNDPMQVLGDLPQLKRLSLKNAAYSGMAMTCSRGKFPELKYLTLKDLDKLEDWTVEKEAMQKLSHLKIHSCQKLKMIPEGLESIKGLKELSISYMPWTFFNCLNPQEIKSGKWVHFQKVKHVPCFRISHILDLESTEVEVKHY